MINEKQSPALEYSRRVFSGVLEWYKNADSKAQVILTLDGALLAFLTSSIFMEQDKLAKIISKFGIETWLLLALMCLTLTGSIFSAVVCLRSRIYSEKELDSILRTAGVDVEKSESYKPEFMFFFQFISRLGERQMTEKLSSADENFEIQALAHDVHILSKNVKEKHKWVNRGFTFAGLSLVLFLAVGINYIFRVIASIGVGEVARSATVFPRPIFSVETTYKFELLILKIGPPNAGEKGQSHQIGVRMAELDKGKPVSLKELMISTLAMTDALAKLLIEQGRHQPG